MNDSNYLKPVTRSITVNCEPRNVWQLISRPGNLERYHPFCAANPVENWPGIKAVDYVHYYNGLKFKRTFTDWQDGRGYTLLIGRENGPRSKVVWTIREKEQAASELEITIYPHGTDKYPALIMPLLFISYIKPMLRKYLTAVLQGLRFHLESGQIVRRNQFGAHGWFSPGRNSQ